MTFKQTITWHFFDEKPDEPMMIVFIDKKAIDPEPITGFYQSDKTIAVSNFAGTDCYNWGHVLCWMPLADLIGNDGLPKQEKTHGNT